MIRQIPIRDFVDELVKRIEDEETIDCCKEEIVAFAKLARDKLGDETIEIDWKDKP